MLLRARARSSRSLGLARALAAEEFCTEFMKLDLRKLENCIACTKGCEQVYNLAADMGGMGFIESNQSVLMYNNTMISFNMLEAARCKGVKRYFYSSSACVYNDDLQLDPENPGLKEGDAWPAKPQDTYGLEKLFLSYGVDLGHVAATARSSARCEHRGCDECSSCDCCRSSPHLSKGLTVSRVAHLFADRNAPMKLTNNQKKPTSRAIAATKATSPPNAAPPPSLTAAPQTPSPVITLINDV